MSNRKKRSKLLKIPKPQPKLVKVAVSTVVHTTAIGFAELPAGKNWDDVTDAFIKYDHMYLTFKDGSTFDTHLDSDTSDGTDWKNPSGFTVHPCNEELDIDWNEEMYYE